MLASALSALALAYAITASPIDIFQSSGGPTAVTKNGTVRGVSLASTGAEAFYGIRYAQAQRFGNPAPVNTSFDGTFDATKFGNVCPGYGVSSYPNITAGQDYNIDEDCLNINIIRPEGTDSSDKLPILFYIFGGGSIQGTANDPRYQGEYLVQRSVKIGKPIIFAGINYRLAAFGFPAGQAAAEAGVLNLGWKDQRAALRWLQDNAQGFGGDASKVTIFGQSAGGASVVGQMAAYGGQKTDLFRGAIVQSGAFASTNSSLATQAPAWSRFLNATGCSDDLACLRALPFDQIYAAGNGTYNPAAIPDGDFLQIPVWQAFKQTKIAPIPLIVGSNLDEATAGIGAPVGINNDTQFLAACARAYATQGVDNTTIARFTEVFPNDPAQGCPYNTGEGVLPTGLQDKRINSVYTSGVDAGMRYLARQQSAQAPVFKYHMTQIPQNGTMELGVAHFYEVPYVFGIMKQTARNPMSQRPGDLETSRQMQEYWINFAHDLVPKASNAPTWDKYSDGQQVLTIKNNQTAMKKDDYRQEPIQFLIDIATK